MDKPRRAAEQPLHRANDRRAAWKYVSISQTRSFSPTPLSPFHNPLLYFFWLLSFICLLVLISKNKTPTTLFPPLTYLRQSPHFIPPHPPSTSLEINSAVVRLWRPETKSLISEQSVNHWSVKFNNLVSFPPCVHLYIFMGERELVLVPYYHSALNKR